MKKLLLSAALLVIAASMIFAQGAEEASAAKKDGPTHIEMWYAATATEVGPLPDDWVGYQRLRDELNVELEASTLPSSATDRDMKIMAAAAADQLPDLINLISRESFLQLVERGLVGEVGDLYQYMPERQKIMFNDTAMKYTTINGKNYGFAVPGGIGRNEGLLIRKDWLDNLGLKVPTTLDELYDVMYAFTFKDPDGNGKNDTYGYGCFVEQYNYEIYPGRRLEPIMGAFGVEGTWDLKADSFGLQIHKPEFYDFMLFMKKMIDTGVIDPNWMAYKKDDFRAAWKQGKFGIFREQNSAYASQNNFTPFDKNFPNASFIVLDPPVGPNGKSSVGPGLSPLRVWVISERAIEEGKGPKIAEFFDWVGAGDGYMLCYFGIEGVQYKIGENGIPVSLEGDLGFNGPKGQTYIQLRNMASNFNSDTELLARYPVWTRQNGTQMSAYWVLKEMQGKKWTDAVGMDSMPVPSGDLKTFYEQGLAEFLAGKRDLTPDNWKAFIDQLDKLGAKEWEAKGLEYAKANSILK